MTGKGLRKKLQNQNTVLDFQGLEYRTILPFRSLSDVDWMTLCAMHSSGQQNLAIYTNWWTSSSDKKVTNYQREQHREWPSHPAIARFHHKRHHPPHQLVPVSMVRRPWVELGCLYPFVLRSGGLFCCLLPVPAKSLSSSARTSMLPSTVSSCSPLSQLVLHGTLSSAYDSFPVSFLVDSDANDSLIWWKSG